MTTATPGFTSVAPGVRGAALAVLAVGLAAVLAAAVLADSAAVVGAAVGAGLVLLFFGFGAVAVTAVAHRLPSASLLVAVLTYTLEVVLLALVFIALTESGATEAAVDPAWLGVTAIVATLSWSFAQILGAVRSRQPIFDLPEAGSGSHPGPAGEVGGGDGPA